MANLVFILVALALLVGFFVLVNYETRRGARVFASARTRLDTGAERIEFIIENVDFGVLIRAESRRIASNLGHDIAHLSLLAIRAVERFLTRIVRRLRSPRVVDIAPRENAREFVKALSDFKGQLKAPYPQMPDVQ